MKIAWWIPLGIFVIGTQKFFQIAPRIINPQDSDFLHKMGFIIKNRALHAEVSFERILEIPIIMIFFGFQISNPDIGIFERNSEKSLKFTKAPE